MGSVCEQTLLVSLTEGGIQLLLMEFYCRPGLVLSK